MDKNLINEHSMKSLNRKNYTQNSEPNDFSFHSISNSNVTNAMPWTNMNQADVFLTPTFNPNHYNLKESVH